jgi:hypothetical protein
MSEITDCSYEIVYEPLRHAEHPSALFRFALRDSDLIADDTFADHANYHQQGIARHLYRTPTGRWVWQIETMWVGDYDRFEAAMDADGVPYDAPEVEHFIQRFGSHSDLELWREDMGQPLPLA